MTSVCPTTHSNSPTTQATPAVSKRYNKVFTQSHSADNLAGHQTKSSLHSRSQFLLTMPYCYLHLDESSHSAALTKADKRKQKRH